MTTSAEKARLDGIRARIEELEAERPTFIGCKVSGCNWHTGGTAEGSEPAKCGGYGGPKGCLADFMAADPEDIDWTEYDR